MAALVVIPARFGSTRFPAKILASATGRPLVQHVVDRVKACRRVSTVLIATDDQRIVEALKPFGTHCVMTSAAHQSGTDRVAEVAAERDEAIVVNVQGDEPEIEPQIVDALIERLERTDEPMATAATRFPVGLDPRDPNLVKVVLNQQSQAIYFSRSAVPFYRDGGDGQYLLHLGIYAYRRDFLLKYALMAQTPLELAEKLEQLRAIETGHKLFVQIVDRATHGIDTPEQYEAFVRRAATRQ